MVRNQLYNDVRTSAFRLGMLGSGFRQVGLLGRDYARQDKLENCNSQPRKNRLRKKSRKTLGWQEASQRSELFQDSVELLGIAG